MRRLICTIAATLGLIGLAACSSTNQADPATVEITRTVTETVAPSPVAAATIAADVSCEITGLPATAKPSDVLSPKLVVTNHGESSEFVSPKIDVALSNSNGSNAGQAYASLDDSDINLGSGASKSLIVSDLRPELYNKGYAAYDVTYTVSGYSPQGMSCSGTTRVVPGCIADGPHAARGLFVWDVNCSDWGFAVSVPKTDAAELTGLQYEAKSCAGPNTSCFTSAANGLGYSTDFGAGTEEVPAFGVATYIPKEANPTAAMEAATICDKASFEFHGAPAMRCTNLAEGDNLVLAVNNGRLYHINARGPFAQQFLDSFRFTS